MGLGGDGRAPLEPGDSPVTTQSFPRGFKGGGLGLREDIFGECAHPTMATSGRISFTVRSILDLPEQDAHSMKQASDHHHHHSAENYSGSPYRGWIETDRNHYPCEYTTDRSSPSPCSYRVFVPRSSGEDAKKRTASACSLQRRGDAGWEFYRYY